MQRVMGKMYIYDVIGAEIKREAYKESLLKIVNEHILTQRNLLEFSRIEITGVKMFFTTTVNFHNSQLVA